MNPKIEALMKHAHNPNKDQKALEAMTPEALAALEAHVAGVEKMASDLAAANEKITAAEAKAGDLAAKVTATEVALKAASDKHAEIDSKLAAVQPIVDAHLAAEKAEKETLVKSLAAHSKTLTEEQLSAKSLDDLRTLAAFAKVDAPKPNFAGRGVPAQRGAAATDFKAPDPWAADLKAAQSK